MLQETDREGLVRQMAREGFYSSERKTKAGKIRVERQGKLREQIREIIAAHGAVDFIDRAHRLAEVEGLRWFKASNKDKGQKMERGLVQAHGSLLRFIGGGFLSGWVEQLFTRTANTYEKPSAVKPEPEIVPLDPSERSDEPVAPRNEFGMGKMNEWHARDLDRLAAEKIVVNYVVNEIPLGKLPREVAMAVWELSQSEPS